MSWQYSRQISRQSVVFRCNILRGRKSSRQNKPTASTERPCRYRREFFTFHRQKLPSPSSWDSVSLETLSSDFFFYFISIRLRTQHKWRWGDKSLYLFESVLKHKTRDEFATKNVTGKPAVDTLASFWIIFETDALLWITRAHLRFQKKKNLENENIFWKM